jgi:type I restriction enzyme, S subunit
MSWETVKLESIVENLDNKRKPLNDLERAKITKIGLYPYIGANNIMGYVDEYIFDEPILCLAEDGGSWGSGQRCAVIYTGKTWVNNHAHVLTAKKGVSLKYIMYFLNHSDLNKYISGSTRGKLTKSSLNNIDVPLPPLHIQQQISDTLDKADALRRKDLELMNKYDELAQAIFYDMFGDPVKNEKGWLQQPISYGASAQGGYAFKSSDIVKTGLRLVKISNVSFENIIWDELVYLPSSFFSKYSEYLLKEGDIVIALTRPIIKSLETVKIARVNKYDIPSLLNQRVARFKINEQVLNPVYFLHFCYTKYFKDKIDSFCSTSLQPNISTSQLESILMLYPPLSLQNEFEKRINIIIDSKVNISSELGGQLFNILNDTSFS